MFSLIPSDANDPQGLMRRKEPNKQTNKTKPVLSGHSKIDKTKILMTKGSLMRVESIAELLPLEHSAVLWTCIKQ